jgi:hypothetical protein
MPVRDALNVLIADAKRKEGKVWTRWPTRLRAAAAVGNSAFQQLTRADQVKWRQDAEGQLTVTDWGRLPPSLRNDIAENGVEDDDDSRVRSESVRGLPELAQELAETTYDRHPNAQKVYVEAVLTPKPARSGQPIGGGGPCPPQGRSFKLAAAMATTQNWNVDAQAVGSATQIVGTVDVLSSDYARITEVLNPEQWCRDSIFWYRSTALGDKKQLPIPDAAGAWRGTLREVVAGMAIFTVDLNIEYRPYSIYRADQEFIVKYTFLRSSDPIVRDDGTITIKERPEGGYTVRVEKLVDFADNPYGGPSSLDLLAPSYMASWLRVQQDQWMERLLA